MSRILFFCAGMFWSLSGWAINLCDLYREFCPNYHVISGGAYPSLGASFNKNPASIPTFPTPVGVEGIASTNGDYSGTTGNMALIKGYKQVGFGASTNSDNTFYDFNLAQAGQGVSSHRTVNSNTANNTVMPTINLGTAVSLINNPKLSFPTIGGNILYNRRTGYWDGGFGTSFNARYFTVGGSYVHHRGKVGIPSTSTTNFSIGTKIGALSGEYSTLFYRTHDAGIGGLPVFSTPIHYVTLNLALNSVYVSYARRWANNLAGAQTNLNLLGVQVKVGKRFLASYLYNYVPGAHSLGFQYFFADPNN